MAQRTSLATHKHVLLQVLEVKNWILTSAFEYGMYNTRSSVCMYVFVCIEPDDLAGRMECLALELTSSQPQSTYNRS
jgi:hypothetical protein